MVLMAPHHLYDQRYWLPAIPLSTGTTPSTATKAATATASSATRLLRTLLPRAQANGINSLIALTLHDNAPARALLHGLGFRKVGASHGVAELTLSLHSPLALAA